MERGVTREAKLMSADDVLARYRISSQGQVREPYSISRNAFRTEASHYTTLSTATPSFPLARYAAETSQHDSHARSAMMMNTSSNEPRKKYDMFIPISTPSKSEVGRRSGLDSPASVDELLAMYDNLRTPQVIPRSQSKDGDNTCDDARHKMILQTANLFQVPEGRGGSTSGAPPLEDAFSARSAARVNQQRVSLQDETMHKALRLWSDEVEVQVKNQSMPLMHRSSSAVGSSRDERGAAPRVSPPRATVAKTQQQASESGSPTSIVPSAAKQYLLRYGVSLSRSAVESQKRSTSPVGRETGSCSCEFPAANSRLEVPPGSSDRPNKQNNATPAIAPQSAASKGDEFVDADNSFHLSRERSMKHGRPHKKEGPVAAVSPTTTSPSSPSGDEQQQRSVAISNNGNSVGPVVSSSGHLVVSRGLGDEISDHEIVRGIDSVHNRISLVRGIIGRQALDQFEQSVRKRIDEEAQRELNVLLFHVEAEMSRRVLEERQIFFFQQIVASCYACVRRDVAVKRRFDDITVSESLNRRRLEQQHELFLASMSVPLKQLWLIWEPQFQLVTLEATRRATIFQEALHATFDAAFAALEIGEELRRRQLLSCRDVMLPVKGVFSASLVLADIGGGEESDWTTFSEVDLMVLRGEDSVAVLEEAETMCSGARVLFPSHEGSSRRRGSRLPSPGSDPPDEWGSYFLQAASTKKPTLFEITRANRRHRLTPASSCAVPISVPTSIWPCDFDEHFCRYISENECGWTDYKKQWMLARYHEGNFCANLTLVDYFGFWRPMLRLCLQETSHRLYVRQQALLSRAPVLTSTDTLPLNPKNLSQMDAIVSWHQREFRRITIADNLVAISAQCVAYSKFLFEAETIHRSALYGFFSAWKGRCSFVSKLRDLEDEAWGAALLAARRNSSSNVSTMSVALMLPPTSHSATNIHRGDESAYDGGVSSAEARNEVPPQTLAAECVDAVSDAGNEFATITSGPSSRSASYESHHLSAASWNREVYNPILAHSVNHSSHSASFERRQAGSPLCRSDSQSSDGLAHRSRLVSELFSLADVAATNFVKLPNIAAALRLKHVSFDLAHIAKCFQRARNLQAELGHNVVATSSTSSVLAATLDREGFQLMLQIMLNDLRVQNPDVFRDLAERFA